MNKRKIKWSNPELVSLTTSDKVFGDCDQGSAPQSGNCSPAGNTAIDGSCAPTGTLAAQCGNGTEALQPPPD